MVLTEHQREMSAWWPPRRGPRGTSEDPTTQLGPAVERYLTGVHDADTVGVYRSILARYPKDRLRVAILTPSTTDVVPDVRHLVNGGGLRD